MKRLTLLSQSQSATYEVALHQGNSICVIKREDPADGKLKFFYSILSSSVMDGNQTAAYTKLPLPEEQSVAGYNLLRTKRLLSTIVPGCFKLVSDQKYVYLFFSSDATIYVCRYMAKEIKNAAGDPSVMLEPAWEVRYKRSRKPDIPYSETDVSDFTDMEGAPFVEPLYTLGLGKDDKFEIDEGSFSVELVPTLRPEENRWQIFVVNGITQRLHIYSFAYSSDSWLQIADGQYNRVEGLLNPDCILDLYAVSDGKEISLCIKGIPATLLYNKKEPAALKEGGHVNLSSSYKIKLMVPALLEAEHVPSLMMGDIDFCIDNEGKLVYPQKEASATIVRYKIGYTEPIDCSIAFNGGYIHLPQIVHTTQSSFIQQLWVYPQNEDTERHYLIGSATDPATATDPLATVWIEYKQRVGFGFHTTGEFCGGISKNNVLGLNAWNNITVVFDGRQYSLYINGSLAELEVQNTGTLPKTILLSDALGIGYDRQKKCVFKGYMDDVRIWKNASALSEALKYMHHELTDDEVKLKPALQGYWKFFEGSGKTVSNSSIYPNLNGTLVSANWESFHSPIKNAFDPEIYVDKDTFLSLEISMIDPGKNPSYPFFGAQKPSTRVSLLNSADGRLHAYYQGQDNYFYKAIYDSLSVKAVLTLPCMGECKEKHYFDFISRRTGSLINKANIEIFREANPYLCTILIDDGIGYTEKWKGVPAQVDALMGILNGQAVSQSGYTDEKKGKLFYDYTGQRYLTYQAYGSGKETGQLLFINSSVSDNRLQKIESRVSGTELDVSFSFSDEGKVSVCLFKSVPADIQRFVLTLRGFNGNYTYTEEQRKAMAGFDLYQIGADGQAGAFVCELARLQGVEVKGGNQAISTGSNAFVVYSNQQGNQTHDEYVDFGGANSVKSELRIFGQDGGWITQAPKQEIYIPFGATLQVPVTTAVEARSFDISKDLTMETWVRGGTTMVDSTSEYEYQRIFHANPHATPSQSAYMLGITPSICMRMMYRTKIEASDCESLFLSSVYTVILYVKPDLQTVKCNTNRFLTRIVDAHNYECLLLDERGCLLLEVVAGGVSKQVNTKVVLSEEKWSMLSFTRSRMQIVIYIDGKQVVTCDDIPVPAGSSKSLYLGGNTSPSLFETRISNVSVWNRAMAEAELSDRYMKRPPVDADGLLLLWEMSDKKNPIENIAEKTAGKHNAAITGDYMWSYPGLFYRVFGAAGGRAVITRDSLIDTEQWNHIAFCRQMEYGIQTGSASNWSAQCPDSNSFNTSTGFTIEGWITPDAGSNYKQVLFSKYSVEKENRSFEFGLSLIQKNDLFINLSLCDKNGKRSDKEFHTKEAVDLSKASFVAVSIQIESVNVGSGGNTKLQTSIHASFNVNGKMIPTQSYTSDVIADGTVLSTSSVPVCLGRTRPDSTLSDQAFFSGKISSFAFFSTNLDEAILLKHYLRPSEVVKQKELVSRWTFREQEGVIAKDERGHNDLLLSEAGMWSLFPEASRIFLTVNGKIVETNEVSVYSFGGYGDVSQVRFGNCLYRGARSNIFNGEINEFRLWSVARTTSQISANMYSYLTGREKGLNAYWNFESEGGDYAIDLTGNGNDARFVSGKNIRIPEWRCSDAPQNNEMPFVVNAIGDKADHNSVKLAGGPVVMEYADTEYDYYGVAYSQIKRGYIYADKDRGLTLSTGFKIGNLKRVYMGQVQSDPTIVGFIEGTPPLPSENLTRPYYLDPASSDYFAYDDCSSVTLTEEKGLEVSLGSSKEKIEKYTISTDDYVLWSIEFDYGALGFMERTLKNDIQAGGHYDEDKYDDTTGDSRTSVAHQNSTVTNQLHNRGDWEKPDAEGRFLLEGRRRYIPRNEGIALVKSSTVDAYMLLLENTDTMVGMAYELNRDIPEDMNYINFPINPLYIKNGTLDGKVGLRNDEKYPGADLERGSYFKPVESYSLKKEIERENNRLAAHYAQFGVGKPSDLKNNDAVKDQFALIAYYDAVKEQFRKDIVNEYIWTAAGGIYNQSDGYVNSIQESYYGNYGAGHDDTGGFSVELVCFGGAKSENTFTHGHHWTLNIEKSKNVENGIRLEVSAEPDPHLGSLTMKEDESFVYSSDPEPGKVDTYRFNTFYLASSKENYNALFSMVIDKEWLNSNDPKAKALLQARGKEGGNAYRILYRVTYVNRVAPSYQNFPLESNTGKQARPVGLIDNALLLSLVEEYCEGDATKLGKAVDEIFYKDLCEIIPEWSLFLQAAEVSNSPEYKSLIQLIDDTVDYMQLYYTTRKIQ